MTDVSDATTDLNALRLFTRYDEGVGPIIVLLHGINADAQDWRPVIDTIGPGYRCIAFDLLGFGESPKPLDIDYSADDHALVIENTLVDLGIEEPFVLVGYSLGGDIAIRYASTYPQRLRRLFLLSAPFYLPEGDYMQKNFSGQMIQAMLMRQAWRFLARGEQDNTKVYKLASGPAEKMARQFLRTNDVPTHWDIMSKNLINCISAATFVDDLPKLTMPVVFAMGIRDPIVRPDQTPALQRIKPDIEIRRIVGLTADHFMLVALPERVGREIIADEVTKLHVVEHRGSGEPIAILVAQEGADAWRPIVGALASRFDVALIELMGFGESPAPPTARYDLGDHVAAVRATTTKLWPNLKQTRIVGFGLGATVALGYAAYAKERASQVVAFSPRLLAPGRTAEESARSADAAALLAAREQVNQMIHDERARGVIGESLERRIIPLYRTLENTALVTDPAPLVAAATARVHLVLPTDDVDAPRVWAHTLAAVGRIELSEPSGGRDVVFAQPGVAVGEIEPTLAAASRDLAPARKRPQTGTLRDFTRAVDRRFVLRGLASAALGALLLAPITLNGVLIARGFAAWVAFSAVTTVIGAVGLRRDGKTGWIPWVLIGVVGVALAGFMLIDQTLAIRLFGWYVAAWVVWRAFTDLFVAWKASDTPSPRWTLWLQGVLALGVAVLALIGSPQAGGRLLRLILGWYFVGSGALLASYGAQSWWRSSRRVHEILAAQKRTGSAEAAE